LTRSAILAPALTLLAAVTVQAGGVPTPVVSSVTPIGYRVRVPFGEPAVRSGEIYGAELVEIEIPGGTSDSPAGAPQLPTRVVLLRIPWDVEPRVSVTPGVARPLGVVRPVPLPYLLSVPDTRARNGAPEIARWLAGAPYLERSAAQWSPLLDAHPAAAGSERYLQLRLAPVHWDPVSGVAEALDAVDIDVVWDRPVAPIAGREVRPGALAPSNATGPRYAAGLRPPPGPRRGAAPVPPRGAEAPSFGAASAAGPVRVSPALPWVRLGVTRPGLYALSAADLAAAGVATAGIDPATFRVFRAQPGDLPESVDVDLGPDALRECAIAVTGEGDGVFDPSDRIYLYATGSTGFGADLASGGGSEYEESLRSGEESLWLTWGAGSLPGAPRRMTARDGGPAALAPQIDTVTHRVHLEENNWYVPDLFAAGLRWERWFYEHLAQGSRSLHILSLPGAAPGGAASVRARAWGKGISLGLAVFDHYLNLSWDQTPVASASWNGSARQDLIASGFAVGTRDTVEFDVPVVRDATDPNRNDESYLAWFEVSYPRRLLAVNDTLQFTAPDSLAAGRVTYHVGGASDTASVWLLDRTDPEGPVRLVGGAWSGGPSSFTLAVSDSVGPGYRPRYTLVSTARAARPASVQRYAPATGVGVLSDLLAPSNGVDYLIVAPEAFLAQAQTLAAYRAGSLSGMPAPRVGIATMERVAAQFGAGLSDPVAIRNLLVYARRYWAGPGPLPGAPPTYLCLLGDATQDPRHYLNFGEQDWVPTYANYYDTDINVQFISDDWLGFLDGPSDQLLDLAVGRLPAASAAEAQALVTGKLQVYEGATSLDGWRARALLSADDASKRELPDEIGNGHVAQMERKDRQHLPYPIERSKVYLNDYAWDDTSHQAKKAARDDFIARVSQGNWLVDYIGHGSESQLADEQLFRDTDKGLLLNAQGPSIFGFFSCTVGRFDELGSVGLGELLLKLPAAGAVASLAATQKVFPNESTELNDSFVEEAFPLRPRVDSLATIGLAWARAKNDHVNRIVRKYVLLGDPGLRPPVPRGRGAWEKAPLDSVFRGEVVTLSGRALNPDSTLDATASGTALLQIQGPPFRRRQGGLSNIGTPDTITYFAPGPVLFRGTVPLSLGRFTATFVVPTDGRIAGSGGQLRALLSSAGGRGTGLAVDSLRIAVGAAARVDVTPPSISLRYPSPPDSAVQPGARLTITLEDSSGIDLMRLDNAHTIFVVLDELGAPTELTPGFQYDPGSHTRGTVDFIVPARTAAGPHLLEVHASDTYRNIAVQTFVLDVRPPFASGDPLFLTQVFNYPNPFARETYVHARLNQPARLRVQVLTVAGRRVREMQADGQAGENYIPWDGRDSMGENVAIGVYLLQVVAEAPGGKRATAVGRALLQR
jgi:hypothetical protein